MNGKNNQKHYLVLIQNQQGPIKLLFILLTELITVVRKIVSVAFILDGKFLKHTRKNFEFVDTIPAVGFAPASSLLNNSKCSSVVVTLMKYWNRKSQARYKKFYFF